MKNKQIFTDSGFPRVLATAAESFFNNSGVTLDLETFVSKRKWGILKIESKIRKNI